MELTVSEMMDMWERRLVSNQTVGDFTTEWMQYQQRQLEIERRAETAALLRMQAGELMAEIFAQFVEPGRAQDIAFSWRSDSSEFWTRVRARRWELARSVTLPPRLLLANVWMILTDDRPEWRSALRPLELPHDVVMNTMHPKISYYFETWCKFEKYLQGNEI